MSHNGRAPADRFGGLFEGELPTIRDGSLLDTPAARAWLELIDRTCKAGDYTFQAPMAGKAGPWVAVDGRRMLNLSSYDYLGLIGDPRLEEAAVEAIRAYGTGTGGVRLLTGTNRLHTTLEESIATFKGTEGAMVFTSGFMANLAAVSALFGPRDRAVLDERVHRSVIDACRMARVPFVRFAHNDVASLEGALGRGEGARRTVVIVDGVYSMDGDLAPLPRIVEAKNRHGALLMVDEAHSFGTMGATGRGLDEHFGVPTDEVDIWMGSLSKSVPTVGGYLAGDGRMMAYLQHGSSPFMFSAALTPPAAAVATEAIRVLRAEPHRVARAHEAARRLDSGLVGLGYVVGASASPIVAVHCGCDDEAVLLASALFRRGVLASAVIPPAVPPGGARLRLCGTAALGPDDVAQALEAFARVKEGRVEGVVA